MTDEKHPNVRLVSSNPDKVVTPLFKIPDPREKTFCRHGGEMLIDDEIRQVKCGLCGRWLDAFTALEVLTREWRQHVEATHCAELRYESARMRLSNVLDQEHRAKARLARARKRTKELDQE